MKIETVSAEEFAEICDMVDVIERNHYGPTEIVVGYSDASGLVLFLIGPSDRVTMASEKGSLPAFERLGLVA